MNIYSTEERWYEAGKLADHLGAEVKNLRACEKEDQMPCKEEAYLRWDEKGLTLLQGKMEVRGDFTRMLPRIRGGHLQHEKLLRAAKLKDRTELPLAVDGTAGLGEDSFILAAGGYHVIMCEYNPVIAALLRDGLERAKKEELIREVAERMELREGSSLEIMARLERKPDLVYLDPMFPPKQKSAITRKKLQLFQQLETPCLNEETLLAAALACGPKRVVVKRPKKGEPLAGHKPSHSIDCRNIRYDCYAN